MNTEAVSIAKEIGRIVIAALALGLRGLFHLGGERRWSLFDIGKYVLDKGGYAPDLLRWYNAASGRKRAAAYW